MTDAQRSGAHQHARLSAKSLCDFDHLDDVAWQKARAGINHLLPADMQKLTPMELGQAIFNSGLDRRADYIDMHKADGDLQERDGDTKDPDSRVLRWIQ